jgi:TPR repeat protein
MPRIEDAKTAYDGGDYATALRIFQALANGGNATAQSNLGVMYDEGYGISQNYTEAVKWYRKAADQGDASAQRFAGQTGLRTNCDALGRWP